MYARLKNSMLKIEIYSFCTTGAAPVGGTQDEARKPFKCIICNISYAYKEDLNEHKVKTHEIAIPFNCGNCNSGFWRKQELFEHVSKSHQGAFPNALIG